jgi:hypothetical protein
MINSCDNYVDTYRRRTVERETLYPTFASSPTIRV